MGSGIVRECLICGHTDDSGLVVCPADGSALKAIMPDPLVGSTIAERYEIIALVGSGGMGNVYKARHKHIDKLVAVKLLHNDKVGSKTSLQRFQQEAKTASSLAHPNIVSVFDYGLTGDAQPYIVMDYIQGKGLHDVIAGDVLSVERCVNIFTQVCDALAHAHQKGIVHRDIKPSNIMLLKDESDNDVAKVLDFGIAKLVEGGERSSASITLTGEVFGSPQYMSPEQCIGKPLDPRSDVYSLGCVIYEALTGRPPILGDNILDIMHKHGNEMPPSFREARMDISIPTQLEAVVMKALEKSPDNRFQSMTVFKRNLEFAPRFPDTQEINLQTSTKLEIKKRKYKKLAIAGLTAVVLAGCAVAILETVGSQPLTTLYLEYRLAAEERTEGISSPKLIPLFDRLSGIYIKHKKYGKAIRVLEDNLRINAQLYGNESMQTALAYEKLGDLFHQVHNLAWKSSYEKALNILHTMAADNRAAGRYAQNEKLDNLTLQIVQKIYGTDHPDVATALLALANDYNYSGNPDLAGPMYQRAIAMREKLLGQSNIYVAEALADYANFHVNEGKYGEAETLYKKALDMKVHALGSQNNDVAELHSRLGDFYQKAGRYEQAEAAFLDALAVERSASGSDTEAIARRLDNLGGFYRQTKEQKKAIGMLQLGLSIKESLAVAPESIARTLHTLGTAHLADENYHKAEECFRKEIDILPLTAPREIRIDALKSLAEVCKLEGKTLEAKATEERIASINMTK